MLFRGGKKPWEFDSPQLLSVGSDAADEKKLGIYLVMMERGREDARTLC